MRKFEKKIFALKKKLGKIFLNSKTKKLKVKKIHPKTKRNLGKKI